MTKLPPWQDPLVRMKSIGSSDIGVILGVSTFLSPVQLYLQKRGELPPQPESEYQRWGLILEEPIAREYTVRTGTKLKRRNQTQRYKLHDWMTSHIDREAIGKRLIVEIKAHGIWGAKEFGDEGTDEIPDSHTAQVTWQMGICGIPQTDLAVLIGGQKFCQYHVNFDPELFAMMVEKAKDFWARVKEGNPPEPESEADCKALWPSAKRSVVVAGLVPTSCAYVYHKKRREHEAEIEELKMSVMQAIGDFEELHDPDGKTIATYKNGKRTALDQTALKEDHPELFAKYMKTTQTRTLLIKERKDT